MLHWVSLRKLIVVLLTICDCSSWCLYFLSDTNTNRSILVYCNWFSFLRKNSQSRKLDFPMFYVSLRHKLDGFSWRLVDALLQQCYLVGLAGKFQYWRLAYTVFCQQETTVEGAEGMSLLGTCRRIKTWSRRRPRRLWRQLVLLLARPDPVCESSKASHRHPIRDLIGLRPTGESLPPMWCHPWSPLLHWVFRHCTAHRHCQVPSSSLLMLICLALLIT